MVPEQVLKVWSLHFLDFLINNTVCLLIFELIWLWINLEPTLGVAVAVKGIYRSMWKLKVGKAELLQVGMYFFFLIHLFAWETLLLKKLEIKETKTT